MNTILAAAFLLLSLPAAATVSTVDGKVSPRATALIPDSVVSTTVTISNLAVGGVIFSSTPADGRLSVDASNLFWDDANNRLGVGTAIPATKFHMSSGTLTVDGNVLPKFHARSGASGATVATSADEIIAENSDAAGISFLTNNTGQGNIYFGDSDDNDVGIIRYDHSADWLGFGVNAGFKMRIISSGFVGIGTINPATKLHMSSGTLTIDGTGGAFSLSGSGTPVTISTWTATYTSGSAHVCVNDSGVLFVSEAACP